MTLLRVSDGLSLVREQIGAVRLDRVGSDDGGWWRLVVVLSGGGEVEVGQWPWGMASPDGADMGWVGHQARLAQAHLLMNVSLGPGSGD